MLGTWSLGEPVSQWDAHCITAEMEHVLLLDTLELYFNAESVRFGILLKMSAMYSDTDEYDIITVLGKGTFGEVTKCWKRNSDHYVAIKILRNYNFRKGVIKCELKILRILQSVDSDKFCIVRFLESFTDDTKLCFVFELLDQNLYEYQKENDFVPLPIRHIRSITKQVLIALQKLKELSIVHTDIKPENIMLVEKAKFPFKVKLIDFGSACILPDIQKIKGMYPLSIICLRVGKHEHAEILSRLIRADLTRMEWEGKGGVVAEAFR